MPGPAPRHRRVRLRDDRSRDDRSRDDRGAAALELALVLPLLMLVLFGIIGYGAMLSFRQAISQAAIEGARAAVVAPPGLSDAQVGARAREAVNDGLGTYGVECTIAGTLTLRGAEAGVCTVSAPRACSASTVGAQCVEVVLDYDYGDHAIVPDMPGIGLVMPDRLRYVTESQVG